MKAKYQYRFFLVPEGQHIHDIGDRIVTIKGDVAESPNTITSSRSSGNSGIGLPTSGVDSNSRNCRSIA